MAESTRATAGLREHEFASLVPEMRAEEYATLLADIEAQGVLQPLEITKAGVVLDGRHRLRVARELGQARLPVRVVAPDDEQEYMVRVAVNRRHLTPGQRAAAVVGLETFNQERMQARSRQRANLKQRTEVTSLSARSGRTRELAARRANVSQGTIQTVLRIQAADPDLFQQVLSGELKPAAAKRALERRERYAHIGQAPPLPTGTFEVIYADPPWQLGNPHSAYAPEQYYPTMPLDQIKALPVPAAEDALLYLWAVNSLLPQAIDVMAAWGFQFLTSEFWDKGAMGLGVWTRNQHELILIGRKGKPSPAPRKLLLSSVIEAPRGAHSAKPSVVYERLEHLYPRRSKLELFARGTPRPGWTAWGNEVERDEAA